MSEQELFTSFRSDYDKGHLQDHPGALGLLLGRENVLQWSPYCKKAASYFSCTTKILLGPFNLVSWFVSVWGKSQAKDKAARRE